MAAIISTWEQSAQYDPLNPLQRSYIYPTGIPGGYGSFYYNRVPNKSVLHGAGLGDLTIPDWLSSVLVGVIGVAAGFYGMKYATPWVGRKLGLKRRR